MADQMAQVDFGTSVVMVDALLDRASTLALTRWDQAGALVQQAAEIAIGLAAGAGSTTTAAVALQVPEADLTECVRLAWDEVSRWDVELARTYPSITRLWLVLTDAWRELQKGEPDGQLAVG